MLIQILVLSVVLGVIILFCILFIIQLMYNNKEFIVKRFNNRFILFYIKYQIILARISLFIFSLVILFGLIELFVGLYYLITQPVPYEDLGIDLHTYVKK